ncbi:hypothetical protein GXM_05264 [Nostoc sphaeroides CCNUC1]|uniref:Uncharacterized protein n=1 Tax=Nostoc sphaeroides CCNUC1 TaxID=2653204 RepID=A0A5P8W586_9NOSO|nr:hypothetical protein GXM_05264 [Nostoc sphaeroides CCNUC1]
MDSIVKPLTELPQYCRKNIHPHRCQECDRVCHIRLHNKNYRLQFDSLPSYPCRESP